MIVTAFVACNEAKESGESTSKETMTENILLAEWDTQFGVPPFDKIKSEDYFPAIEIAIARHKEEIKAIIENPDEPTFANTIEALEFSGADLNKVSYVFYEVAGANTDSILQDAEEKLAPIMSSHGDDINLNPELFKRVKAVYDKRETLNLERVELRLLEETYKDFVRSGVNVEGEDKERLKAINTKLAELSQKFGANLLAETNNFEFHTTNKEDLGNLPASLVSLAEEEAITRKHEDGYSITLQRPSINPFLQSSPNRDARKVLFDGYAMRGNNGNENDNTKILSEMAALRAERAKLLGYETHAHYKLSNSMAQTPEAVFGFMDKLWPSALKMAKAEREALAVTMKKEGVEGEFTGSDWRHYVEKVRKERYAYDEEETRPYFEFNNVKAGVFQLATDLFGLTFKELKDIPRYHQDQQVFEVLDNDGSHLGILYMDFFARESKRGGAWMNELRGQSNVNGMIRPIVTNNFNYPAPSKGGPSLLSYSEAETLFHEFGHALHGLFSMTKYGSQAGTNVPRDFVEFPSQVMENWMSEPEVLKTFAKHYQTGEVIPDEIIAKMKAANSFNGGFGAVEYMAAAYLDMAWHTLKDSEHRDANSFEKEAMDKLGLIDEIIPRYRSPYFSHIFDGGYSSGYYSYLWSEVLDADAFQSFKDAGSIYDQETAKRFRNMLSQGGSKPGMDLYVEFRGQEPEIAPLLKKKGFE